jgi:hypothetical protein
LNQKTTLQTRWRKVKRHKLADANVRQDRKTPDDQRIITNKSEPKKCAEENKKTRGSTKNLEKSEGGDGLVPWPALEGGDDEEGEHGLQHVVVVEVVPLPQSLLLRTSQFDYRAARSRDCLTRFRWLNMVWLGEYYCNVSAKLSAASQMF